MDKCTLEFACCILRYLQRLNGEAEVSCTEEQLKAKCNASALLHKENTECKQNIEDEVQCQTQHRIEKHTDIETGTIGGVSCVFTLPFLWDVSQRDSSETDV